MRRARFSIGDRHYEPLRRPVNTGFFSLDSVISSPHSLVSMAKPTRFRAHRWPDLFLPGVPSGLSRKRYRKRQRQRRRAAKVAALAFLNRFEGVYPDVVAALAGICPCGTESRKDSVLDILDTTPLNLQGT